MSQSKFRAIAADLAERIFRGEFPPGTRLPAERMLAAELGVNRSTIVAAYDELMGMGLVSRRQGSGTFVENELWGVSPDWQRYISGASFGPARPLLQQIRQARNLPGMIDLSEGVIGTDLVPHDMIQQQMAHLSIRDNLGYPDPLGDRWLREVLAERLSHFGIQADPNQILITSGTQQAIYLIMRALLRPGDAVAIEQPSYYYSLSAFQSAGIRLFPLPVNEQGIDLKQVRQLYEQQQVRLVLTNPTHQNPTGMTLSQPQRNRLLALCRSLNLPIVEDDACCELALDGPPPAPLKTRDDAGRVLYVGSASKTLGPGLRIGWLVGVRTVIERLAEVKGQIDFGTSILPQRVAAAVMETPAWLDHLHRLRLALRTRRDVLVEALKTHFGDTITFQVPSGGLHLWVSWKDSLRDSQRLELAVRSGIVLTPGRVYGTGDGYARLTYAKAQPEQLTAAVERLAAVMGRSDLGT